MTAGAPSTRGKRNVLPATVARVFACQICGRPLNVTIWQIIDLALNSTLRRQLIERTLHDASCLHCKTLHRFSVAFVVWEPLSATLLGFYEEPQASGVREHLGQLAASLRKAQPAAIKAHLSVATSPGALVDVLLQGNWSLCEAAGFESARIWAGALALLPEDVRIGLLDLLLKEGYARLLASVEGNRVIAAALHLANDDAQRFPLIVREALLAITKHPLVSGELLIETILPALAVCPGSPPGEDSLHPLFQPALLEASRELSLIELEKDASRLTHWCDWICQRLFGIERAITLYNLAGGVFDRLNAQQYSGAVAEALQVLFNAVLDVGQPVDLMPMAGERLGELRLCKKVPDIDGCDDLRRAAGQFSELQQPSDAARVWLLLMRWYASRVDSHGCFTGMESALEAGEKGLACASTLSFENDSMFSRRIAGIALSMPGKGGEHRQEWATRIYRNILSKSTGRLAKDQAVARLQIADALLGITIDTVISVEEAISVLTRGGHLMPLFAECGLHRRALSILARAYKNRVTGNPGANMDKAVSFYRQALTGDTPPGKDPMDTDEMQNSVRYNLGNALIRCVSGDRRKNLTESLALLVAVEKKRRSMNAPTQLMARSWLAIGNAFYELALLDKPLDKKRLHQSINAYAKARKLFDPLMVPAEAATALMLLGQAMSFAISSSRDFLKTVKCYEEAAKLAAQAGDLVLQEKIAAMHGSLLFRTSRLPEAVSVYADALSFRYRLMASAISGLTRQHQLTAIAPYATRMAYGLILDGQLDSALDVLGSARALELSAALQGVSSQKDSPELVRYREARARLLSLEFNEQSLNTSVLDSGAEDGLIDPREAFGGLHQQLQEARDEVQLALQALSLSAEHSCSSGTGGVALRAEPDELLVMPLITDIGSLIVFSATDASGRSQSSVVLVNGTRLSDIQALTGLRVLPGDSGQTSLSTLGVDCDPKAVDEDAPLLKWRQIVASVAEAESKAELADAVSWMDVFFDALGRTAIMEAIFKQLDETGRQRLRLVGLGALQTLPFSMAFDPASRLPLMCKASVTTQIGLTDTRQQTGLPISRRRILIVVDPQDNLPLSRWEASMIVQASVNHADVELLQGSDATIAALLERIADADILHFAGHAAHDVAHPSRSRLICADGALSIQQLATTTTRTPLELVVLSACNTHHIDAYRLPDEFVGLPGAFFALGVQAVISSMWPVSDEATAVLMAEFYRQLLEEQSSYGQALCGAQRYLANGTAMQLRLADRLKLYADSVPDSALARRILGYRRRPEFRPFEHSIYWGAQVCQVR